MKTLIVIPARFSSKRFPGKPLAKLEGKTILQRVWDVASAVCERVSDCAAVVATETPSAESASEKIVQFCETRKIPILITSKDCRSGSDRVWEVANGRDDRPDVVVNLQGDNPICPVDFVVKMIESLEMNPTAAVASVYTRLSWTALDEFRAAKKTSPFSGTTVVLSKNDEALWFSKNIIPAIRDEEKLRTLAPQSPICRHVGLYAYRFNALKFFAKAEKGEYERLEQLEQLRFLENGYKIQMTPVVYPTGYEKVTSGVDTLEDLERVASIIRKFGEIKNDKSDFT